MGQVKRDFCRGCKNWDEKQRIQEKHKNELREFISLVSSIFVSDADKLVGSCF
jgi:hypothetical protein